MQRALELLEMGLKIVVHADLAEGRTHGGYLHAVGGELLPRYGRLFIGQVFYVFAVNAAHFHTENALFLHGLYLFVQHRVGFVRESGKDELSHA